MDAEMGPFLTGESIINKENTSENLECAVDILETPWEEREEGDIAYDNKRVTEQRAAASKTNEKCQVDLMDHFDRVFEKKTFDSFKEFDELFTRFKRETGSVFRIKSSCSVSYENSRRKQHFIPSRFKFVSVKYCCVHYGQPKVSGQGIRTKQRYLPCGCGSVLSVAYNRGALFISQVNMKHNHEVSNKIAPYYAMNRRITNHELRQVADIVAVMPSSRALQFFLKEHFHKPMTLQDAKNTRARLKTLQMKQVPNSQLKEVSQVKFINSDISNKEVGNEVTIKEEKDERKVSEAELKQCFMPEGDEQDTNKKEDCPLEVKTKAVSDMMDKFAAVLSSCDTALFWERIGVMNKVLDCWENGENLDVHYAFDSTGDNSNIGSKKSVCVSSQVKKSYLPLHLSERISSLARSEVQPVCSNKARNIVSEHHVKDTSHFKSGSSCSSQVSVNRSVRLVFPQRENKSEASVSSRVRPRNEDILSSLENPQEVLDDRTTNQGKVILSEVSNDNDSNCPVILTGISKDNEDMPYITCYVKDVSMDSSDQANEVKIEITNEDIL